MSRHDKLIRQRKQRGIVLPVVLVMLLVLTVSSLVIVEQISSQTRMAASAGIEQVTLQAAETGLVNVTNELSNGTISSAIALYAADTNGYYLFSAANYSKSTPLPWMNTATWASLPSNPNSVLALCTNGSAINITSCQYMVEMLPQITTAKNGTSNVFRITVRVVGPNGHGIVMLQTTYKLAAS